jgi:hypothetical protein
MCVFRKKRCILVCNTEGKQYRCAFLLSSCLSVCLYCITSLLHKCKMFCLSVYSILHHCLSFCIQFTASLSVFMSVLSGIHCFKIQCSKRFKATSNFRKASELLRLSGLYLSLISATSCHNAMCNVQCAFNLSCPI